MFGLQYRYVYSNGTGIKSGYSTHCKKSSIKIERSKPQYLATE